MPERIELNGFEDIDSFEKDKVTDISLKFIEKNNRTLKNIEFLHLRLKECCSTEGKKKYFVDARLGFSGTQITSSGEEWNLVAAVDDSLARIEKELQKRFSHRKITEKQKRKIRKTNRLLE